MQPFSPIQGITQQINPIQSFQQAGALGGDEKVDDKMSFANIMSKQLYGANEALNDSGKMTKKLMLGQVKNPHDVAISGQKAGIMLKLTTTICSKVSSACTTLFQMQI